MSFYLYVRGFLTEEGAPFTVKYPEHVILNGAWKVALIQWKLNKKPDAGGVFILADICDWSSIGDTLNKVHKKAQVLRWTGDIGNNPSQPIYVPVIVQEFDTITIDIIKARTEAYAPGLLTTTNFTLFVLHFKKDGLDT